MKKIPLGVSDMTCTRMLTRPKKNVRPRLVLDMSQFTKAGIRETHHTRSQFKVVSSVARNMLRTTLDAVDGYHGIRLAEEDQHKTTFIIDWCR